jgi:hypothetical protein
MLAAQFVVIDLVRHRPSWADPLRGRTPLGSEL